MRACRWMCAGAVAVALVVAPGLAGQQNQAERKQENPPEREGKVGKKVDEAIRDVKKGVQEAAQSVRESFDRMRTAVHNMGIEARVYSRLHWDKALNNANLELDVHNGGIATLRGTVPDAGARSKAVALARDTVGVTQVIDQLAVSAPAAPGRAEPVQRPPR
jgi:hyperosmotically inducible periplasmic protein